jgi:hypothetical protein
LRFWVFQPPGVTLGLSLGQARVRSSTLVWPPRAQSLTA